MFVNWKPDLSLMRYLARKTQIAEIYHSWTFLLLQEKHLFALAVLCWLRCCDKDIIISSIFLFVVSIVIMTLCHVPPTFVCLFGAKWNIEYWVAFLLYMILPPVCSSCEYAATSLRLVSLKVTYQLHCACTGQLCDWEACQSCYEEQIEMDPSTLDLTCFYWCPTSWTWAPVTMESMFLSWPNTQVDDRPFLFHNMCNSCICCSWTLNTI